jgi:hypothetical protein
MPSMERHELPAEANAGCHAALCFRIDIPDASSPEMAERLLMHLDRRKFIDIYGGWTLSLRRNP